MPSAPPPDGAPAAWLRDEAEWTPVLDQVPLDRGGHNVFALRHFEGATHGRRAPARPASVAERLAGLEAGCLYDLFPELLSVESNPEVLRALLRCLGGQAAKGRFGREDLDDFIGGVKEGIRSEEFRCGEILRVGAAV